MIAVLGLGVILALVLVLPLSVRWIEEELEGFLLVMGLAAVTLTGGWSWSLAASALGEPLPIAAAVLAAGFAFRAARGRIRRRVEAAKDLPKLLFCLVAGLGLLSSAITAIIAALILVEALSALRLPAASERRIAILGCFSIGFGAALTPLGEPLSTIAAARLGADFFYLARLIGPWVLPAIFLLGAFASACAGPRVAASKSLAQDEPETGATIVVRALKVFVFVAALVLLGHGFSPLVERWVVDAPAPALFWINLASAVLDNATLASAELSPRMEPEKLRFALLGMLVAGGMLIPGNIPNIICAKKLGIGSREWARFGVPLGLALMGTYFILLLALTYLPAGG